MTLVRMLQKKDKLPVVAFTFSRARCDNNADSLTTLDLTTSAEKHFIHTFVMASIGRLKGTDKQLPQVNRVEWSVCGFRNLLSDLRSCNAMNYCVFPCMIVGKSVI